VLAVGGEKSFGATEAVVMRNVAVNVRQAVVPGSGHWLMEENPSYTVALIRSVPIGAAGRDSFNCSSAFAASADAGRAGRHLTWNRIRFVDP
jgi:hypothetical protein